MWYHDLKCGNRIDLVSGALVYSNFNFLLLLLFPVKSRFFWASLHSFTMYTNFILKPKCKTLLHYILHICFSSDRSGLKEPDAVEKLQDSLLGAFKRYVSTHRPLQPLHWAKILMKVTDLRTISTRHAERVLCIRLDHQGDIPPQLLDLFNEGQNFLWLERLYMDGTSSDYQERMAWMNY